MVIIDYKAIGKRIKIARIKLDMTQEELANIIGVTTVHVCNIENGNTKLSLPVFIHIANALSVSGDDLLCDNILHSKQAYEREIVDMTKDCDDYEIRIMAYLLKATKMALREDRNLKDKMSEFDTDK